MVIPIPIPIGVTRVATVQGAVWKFVSCTHCQHEYAYLLELEATGEDHDLLFLDAEGSSERARTSAAQNLVQKSHNVVLAVPCPNCGFYQDDMARKLKNESAINGIQIAGLIVVLLSLVPLAFDIPQIIWILTAPLAFAGLSLMIYGYVVAFRFDPNAGDPEARKALGQRHAVWGEQLAQVRAASREVEQNAPADLPSIASKQLQPTPPAPPC